MDLKTCYERIGGSYSDIMDRLGKEERVAKFFKLFLRDTNYEDLCRTVEEGDWETAFRAAHSLKGVALNLAFSTLAASTAEVTEVLRSGAPSVDIAPLMEKVKEDYARTDAGVKEFLAGLEG